MAIRQEEGRWPVKRGGLGRGLSSLIPGATEERGLLDIPVSAIARNPRQPRGEFPEETLEALARSIREVGVLQPVVVRPRDGGYELVAGERRLRAAKLAGLATIPAIVREGDDTESLREALIENIHREDLAPLELAAAFQELLEDLGVTQEMVAERLGYSRAHVANTIRLLSLPGDVQRLLAEGRIQAGHARALLGLPDDDAGPPRGSGAALRQTGRGSGAEVHGQAEPGRLPSEEGAGPHAFRGGGDPFRAAGHARPGKSRQAEGEDRGRLRLQGRPRADRLGDRWLRAD